MASEQHLNMLFEIRGRHRRTKTGGDLAHTIDEEFRKVPFDCSGCQNFLGSIPEKPVKRMRASPFTSIFSNIGNVTLYFRRQNWAISDALPGSWVPN
jgi:hypothetical protein